jgi:chromosome segregation ATPase
LSFELDWYCGHYGSLDALVEALRTDNGWLEYQLQAVRDELLDQGTQTAEGGFAVDMVRSALLERDEALQKAREALAAAQIAAAEKEMVLASAQAQLQQDRTTLEGAWYWQSQAEEKAKEAEQLRVDLADKVASLAVAGEQLRHEQGARQAAESRLQQEQSAHKEAQATLERESIAREEVQGQLQQERATLEKAQATIKVRDEEVTRLNGELAQLSVSYEDQCPAGEEKDVPILDLQRAAETTRTALETKKKQVEGELFISLFVCWPNSFGDPLPVKFVLLF